MSCVCCRFLYLSKDREEHIMQRHFLLRNRQDTDPGEIRSFFRKSMSPDELFHHVRMIPRFQLRGRWGRRSRFVYNLSFGFDVGIVPLHHGPNRTTNRVEIVCACVRCPACGVHPPTKIVTIYPVH